jgi:hypothetical protein
MARATEATIETEETPKAKEAMTAVKVRTTRAATRENRTDLSLSDSLMTNSKQSCKSCSKNGSMSKLAQKRRRRMRVHSKL